jgi:hypothetical protein
VDIIEEGQESGAFRRDISPGLATNVVFGAVDELVTELADHRSGGRSHPPSWIRFSTLLTKGMMVVAITRGSWQ